MCGGTGFSGDAMDYLYPQYALRISGRRERDNSSKRTYDELLKLAIIAAEQTSSKIKRGN